MKEPSWQWSVRGKHPAANDYIHLGQGFPLAAVFADWVKNGYHLAAPSGAHPSRLCSWRFWTRGAGSDVLVFGLVRDSSDRLGRPYPLLVMGTGPLPGWEERWDLVSLACENAWCRMEHQAAASMGRQSAPLADVRRLEAEILAIKPPMADWTGLLKERESWPGAFGAPASMSGIVEDVMEKEEVFIDLNQGRPEHGHLPLVVSSWHRFLKAHLGDMPKVVFMGGTADKTFLAVFLRPLKPADFVRLWSL
ncbi:MAG: TagF domain-containing protein [bacterium]